MIGSPKRSAERPDVCIIGAGVAGAMTAWKLGRAGIRTTILEAGPRYSRDAAMDRMRMWVEGVDPYHSTWPARDVYSNGGEIDYPLNDHRVRGVGGSTMHWVGYTPRFLADDFRMRSRYGVADDWPIGYDELEPFYQEAETEMGVAGARDNPFASPRSGDFPLPAFPIGYDERILVDVGKELGITFHTMPQARTSEAYRDRPPCVTYSACRACPIRARYSGDIHVEMAEATGNVRVIPNACVVRLETHQDGRVRRAVYMTPEGDTHAVDATVFVVAAHAVESARLLLLSAAHNHPDGLANSSGLVGRYFMEHMGQYRVATLDRPVYPGRKGFVTILSQQFHATGDRDLGSGFLVRGNATSFNYHSLARGLAIRSGEWGEPFAHQLERRVEERFGRDFLIGTNAEPLPTESNRVELDPELKDVFGNPAPRLHYSLSEYERIGYEKGDEVILSVADVLRAESLGPHVYHFGSHHAGTCRMGDDPTRSVVDRNLRAHDAENLYVVGSSTFVTLSLVNPTLTIAALALRLGDHLVASS